MCAMHACVRAQNGGASVRRGASHFSTTFRAERHSVLLSRRTLLMDNQLHDRPAFFYVCTKSGKEHAGKKIRAYN